MSIDYNNLETGPIIFVKWTSREKGIPSWVSNNVESWGYKKSEVLNDDKGFFSLIHPDDTVAIKEEITYHIKQNSCSFELCYRILSAEGNVRWVKDFTSRTQEDTKGYCYVGYIFDLTKEKELEERLSETEEKYRLLVEESLNGTYIVEEGKWTYVNPKFAAIFGYSTEELVSQPIEKVIYKDDIDLVRYNLNQRLNGDIRGIQYKFRGVKKDGTLITVEVLGNRYKNADKTAIFGTLVDITEANKATEKLRMASKVFENTIEGVAVTDRDGEIQWVNPAFTVITGYNSDEAIGKNPRILRSEKHNTEFYEEMWRSLIEVGQWQGEIWNRRKNGETYPEWLTISAIKDEDGKTAQYVSVFNDISERVKREEHIKYQAYHDALTKLPNRYLLYDRLKMMISHANRNKEKLAVMLLDLDRFKRINDTMGHPAGDLLLQEVATRLKDSLRDGDTVSRLGGDEFCIILEDIKSIENVLKVSQKIFKAFSKPFVLRNHELYVTTSIGVSIFPNDGDDVETLIKNADTAMYEAKAQGRNNVRLYTASMNDEALERLAIENEIIKGLEKNEFVVYYQPQLNLSTGRITGAEALVRWQHPELGFLLPGKFISIAEETGLIELLGNWVLNTSCFQNQLWQDNGFSPISISVNLSAIQFQQQALIKSLNNTLKKSGLLPKYLDLEITESSAIQDPEFAITMLKELKKSGIQLSMDDFGTGYSSLALLNRLPIDRLKIDRSFISNIVNDNEKQAIVAAIIAMAKSLRLKVVAEGVETKEQMAYLKSLNCDEIQGYFISPPVKAEDFEVLLKKYNHDNADEVTICKYNSLDRGS